MADIMILDQAVLQIFCSQGPLCVQFRVCFSLFEPPHDKTNKMACAPIEDSDQPEHPPSLSSLRCPHEESLGP